MKQNPNRRRIIPDRLFHKLWDACKQYDNFETYYQDFTYASSEKKINFLKYDIDISMVYNFLEEIYIKHGLSFADILKMSHKTKSQISHSFCIPIRTIEDWFFEQNRCPDYIKLMLIRHYQLFSFKNHIYIESEYKKSSLRKARSAKLNNTKKISVDSICLDEPKHENLCEPGDLDDTDFLSYLDNIHPNIDPSVYSATNTHELLSKTDYLKKIIKKSE